MCCDIFCCDSVVAVKCGWMDSWVLMRWRLNLELFFIFTKLLPKCQTGPKETRLPLTHVSTGVCKKKSYLACPRPKVILLSREGNAKVCVVQLSRSALGLRTFFLFSYKSPHYLAPPIRLSHSFSMNSHECVCAYTCVR